MNDWDSILKELAIAFIVESFIAAIDIIISVLVEPFALWRLLCYVAGAAILSIAWRIPRTRTVVAVIFAWVIAFAFWIGITIMFQSGVISFNMQGVKRERDIFAKEKVHSIASTPTPTPCDGSPKRLQVGSKAQVCTWRSGENVRIRSEPRKNSTEIARLVPGAVVDIIGGPVCDPEYKWWYWKIETQTKHYIGWMAEGGDEKDPYFLCPYP